jgi:hypothetical protein
MVGPNRMSLSSEDRALGVALLEEMSRAHQLCAAERKRLQAIEWAAGPDGGSVLGEAEVRSTSRYLRRRRVGFGVPPGTRARRSRSGRSVVDPSIGDSSEVARGKRAELSRVLRVPAEHRASKVGHLANLGGTGS